MSGVRQQEAEGSGGGENKARGKRRAAYQAFVTTCIPERNDEIGRDGRGTGST